MLELSLVECAFIGLVALIFIGPEELPNVIRQVGKFIRSAKAMVSDVKGSFAELADEAGVNEVKRELEEDAKFIEDLDGNMQRIYDVSDIHDRRKDKEGDV